MAPHRQRACNNQQNKKLKTEIGISIYEIQSILRKQLGFSCKRSSLGNEQHLSHLKELIKRTALMGESNSVLIIGPRGCGKSALLESAKEEVFAIHEIRENMIEVHLNGLLHTDDRIALKDITQQLKLENIIDGKVFGSFSENLTFLLDALKTGKESSKSVLFILDEFDLFCYHKNQTLLYNLFDAAQSAHAPIAVVGLTCRLDVIELLEKRVKSRFSHRQLYLFNQLTFDDYLQSAEFLLSLPDDYQDCNIEEWNSHVKVVLEDSSVRKLLRRLFDMTKDIRTLKHFLIFPVSLLSENHSRLEAEDFLESHKNHFVDSKASILHGLSILEITLIVAMVHLTHIYEEEPFNFELVYKEYLKFAQKKSSLQDFDKAVIMKSFEHLQALELVHALDGGNQMQKQYRQVRLLIDPSQVKESLARYPNLPTQLHQWATSVITE